MHVRKLLGPLLIVLFGATELASAQDLQSIFKGALNGRLGSVTDLLSALRSVAEASQGSPISAEQKPVDSDGKVILYRTAWCGYCKREAAYMQSKNIAFDERDIEKNKDFRAEYSRIGGKGGVPLTVFGPRTMVGFSEPLFDKNFSEYQAAQPVSDPSRTTAPTATAAATAPDPTKPVWQAGDTVVPKIAGIRLYRTSDRQTELLKLGRSDELIYMGEERNGMLKVTSSAGEGWVDKLLMRRP